MSTIWYVLWRWCDTGDGGGWGPGCLPGAGGLPGAVVVGALLILPIYISLSVRIQSYPVCGVALRAVGCCVLLVSAAPARVGCFLPATLLVCVCSVFLIHTRVPAPRFGVLFLGIPAAVCAATPIPTITPL